MLMQFSPTLCFLFVLLVTPTRGEKAIGFLANEGRSSQRLSFSAGKERRSKRCRILWLSLPPLLFLTSFRLFKFSGLFFFFFSRSGSTQGAESGGESASSEQPPPRHKKRARRHGCRSARDLLQPPRFFHFCSLVFFPPRVLSKANRQHDISETRRVLKHPY